MLGKVRRSTHRGNGLDPQPKAGLSEGRLALIHRYMLEEPGAQIEEAEPTLREEASASAAQEQAMRDAAERTHRRMERERRRTEKLFPADPSTAEDWHPTSQPDVISGAVAEAVHGNDHLTAAVRPSKALAKADKRAAKQAARQIAALEKREARERKALAKAAARRKVT